MRETHCGFTMGQILKKFPEWKVERSHYLIDGIYVKVTDEEGESYNITIKPHDEVKQLLTSSQATSMLTVDRSKKIHCVAPPSTL